MNDRELETRLRTHLHRRFDDGSPSPELIGSVQQVLRTNPDGVRFGGVRGRPLSPSWSFVGVAALIAIVALAAVRIGPFVGPGDQASNAPGSPSFVPGGRQFIVLPPVDAVPTKTESSLAADVLHARLRALIVAGDEPGSFTSAVGNAITFHLPMAGPSDESIRAVLRAQGDVAIVPLPESYTDGTHTAEVGQNLPTDEPALFGWDGIASAAREVDHEGRSVLTISLRPAASDAFGDYTTSHVGGSFAVVVDDDVALAPVINEPIIDGRIQVSGGLPRNPADDTFAQASAILVGGKLPAAWSSLPPLVPEILQPHELAAGLARELPGVIVESADLDAVLQGRRWVAVWRTHLAGRIADDVCAQLSVQWRGSCPVVDPSMTFTFEAETGELISAEPSDS